jgi:uncharacterized protein (DUF433 family)
VDTNGVIRIGGTRIPLETVIAEYRNGADADEIAYDYDALQLADVHTVISYYLKHSSEVTAYLAEREERAEQVRAENERRSPSEGWRERLLARRHKAE